MNWRDLDEAKEMILLSQECGADLCKFQLFDSKKLYGEKIPQELTFNQAKMLFDYGKSEGIEVFFSVFDIERVKWCERIGVKRYKLAYSVNDKELLIKVYGTGKPVFRSCDCLLYPDHTLLYCDGLYPSDPIPDWVDFDLFYGYSDHSIGIDQCKEAIDRGCRLIEKHFTLGYGVDKDWSMTLEELRGLVEYDKKHIKE